MALLAYLLTNFRFFLTSPQAGMKPANFSSVVYRSYSKNMHLLPKDTCCPEIDGLFSRKRDVSTAYFPPFAPSWETGEEAASRACIPRRETPVQGDSSFLDRARVQTSLPRPDLNAVRLPAPFLQKAEDSVSLPLDGELEPAKELMDFAPLSSTDMPVQTSKSQEVLAN